MSRNQIGPSPSSTRKCQPPRKSVTARPESVIRLMYSAHREEAEAHAAVLGVVAGDELLLGLGEVEGRACRLCGAGEQEDDEADELRHDVPARPVLPATISVSESDCAISTTPSTRERERDLVRDELRAGAHRAEERVLRVGGPAADDEAVDADRADREDEDQRDRDVGDLTVDLVAEDLPARAERDHRERRERREGGDERARRCRGRRPPRRGRSSPCGSASQVGDRLEEPERPGAVRPVAELHPPHHLPLEPASGTRSATRTRLMMIERLDQR